MRIFTRKPDFGMNPHIAFLLFVLGGCNAESSNTVDKADGVAFRELREGAVTLSGFATAPMRTVSVAEATAFVTKATAFLNRLTGDLVASTFLEESFLGDRLRLRFAFRFALACRAGDVTIVAMRPPFAS